MSANINDHFCATTNGSRPSPTTLTVQKEVGSPSISCSSLGDWETGTAVHFILYTTDSQGNKVLDSQTDWKGIVSGNTVTNLSLKAGVDKTYPVGSVVVCAPTGAWADDLIDGILISHNQDGTLKDDTVDKNNIKTDAVGSDELAITISTDANGWTCYDYGNHKKYCKNGITGSDSIGAFPSWKKILLSNLPSGMSTLGSNFILASASASDEAVTVSTSAGSASTDIRANIGNLYGGGSVTYTVTWSLCITTPEI